jgi:RNA polymerase sigma-70 factor, ECF subfamily
VFDTSASLLEGMNRGESEYWQRFYGIYTPLIRRWLRRDPTLHADAEDLTQIVLGVVVEEIKRFDRQRQGSFRRWLRLITVNRLKDYWRERQKQRLAANGGCHHSILMQLEDPDSELSQQWDQEHDYHVVNSLLMIIQPEFNRTTWKAFKRYCMDEIPAEKVAAQLGVSKNVVMLAKSRVLKRLREVGHDIIG